MPTYGLCLAGLVYIAWDEPNRAIIAAALIAVAVAVGGVTSLVTLC